MPIPILSICRCLLLSLGALLISKQYAAAHLIADLASYNLVKGKDFTDQKMVISGVADNNADIIVIIRGPKESYRVWRRERNFGIWSKKQYKIFHNIHSYFIIASSSDNQQYITPELADHLMVSYPDLLPISNNLDPSSLNWRFYQELVASKQKISAYSTSQLHIERIGNNIFRLVAPIPNQASTGNYQVDVYSISNQKIEQSVRLYFVISNVALDQELKTIAARKPLYYSIIAVLTGLLIGMGASFFFRKY